MLDPLTQRHFDDLARWMALQCRRAGRCLVFGINGAQGSGKSTLAGFLRNALQDAHGLRAAVLSLDDCYLGRADRLRLAAQQHPLFATRGVPGTHDPALGRSLLDRLRELRAGESLALPAFSKALDDRLPESRWPLVHGPLDLIL
jgi:D-glycerate 3-kinase